jgi:hypothetical protein
MTIEQALDEGRRRWGDQAFASIRPEWQEGGVDKIVGIFEKGKEIIKGTGATFEQAISFADKIASLIT